MSNWAFPKKEIGTGNTRHAQEWEQMENAIKKISMLTQIKKELCVFPWNNKAVVLCGAYKQVMEVQSQINEKRLDLKLV